MTSQDPCRPPPIPNQGTDCKGVPLPEVQDRAAKRIDEPPGGFQGGALRLVHAQAIALVTRPFDGRLTCCSGVRT